jgi:hypothetical protein
MVVALATVALVFALCIGPMLFASGYRLSDPPKKYSIGAEGSIWRDCTNVEVYEHGICFTNQGGKRCRLQSNYFMVEQ